MRFFIIGIIILFLFFLVGCDQCYFQDGQNIQVTGNIISNQSDDIYNDTCTMETHWVVVQTTKGCLLNVLKYKYSSCSNQKTEVDNCIEKDLPSVDIKGIYGKVEVRGDFGTLYYDVTPYTCAGN